MLVITLSRLLVRTCAAYKTISTTKTILRSKVKTAPATLDSFSLLRALVALNGKRKKMPLYEYECEACGHTWDVEQSIKAEPECLCPQCLRKTAKRIIPKTNFALKGQGWARDGYR